MQRNCAATPHRDGNAAFVEVRPMMPNDLHAVLAIQAVCYTQIEPESLASFEAKLAAAPASCYVATAADAVVGYLVALPSHFASPPQLDAQHCVVPAAPDCLYLHDLAVAPAARAAGAGRALVDAFFSHLEMSQLDRASLIAIQNSAPYWQRHGFRAATVNAALRARLHSYGHDVQYMEFSSGR